MFFSLENLLFTSFNHCLWSVEQRNEKLSSVILYIVEGSCDESRPYPYAKYNDMLERCFILEYFLWSMKMNETYVSYDSSAHLMNEGDEWIVSRWCVDASV